MSVPKRLSLSAPAKINLSLHICARRSDGYHELESLVAFADIGDRIGFEKAAETSLSLSGPFAEALAADDNLVLRAHAMLIDYVGQDLPCHMTLEKNLPIASGIGGGSADAAATLNGLNRYFDLALTPHGLSEIAAALGADVPVCLSPAPAWMTGIGHDVTRLPALPAADIVLVNPMQALATPAVFKALAASPVSASSQKVPQPVPERFTDLAALIAFASVQGNALTAAAQALVPDIADCIAALHKAGAAYAAMSGSGATCFALAPSGEGGAVAARYGAMQPRDWVQAGRLLSAAA